MKKKLLSILISILITIFFVQSALNLTNFDFSESTDRFKISLFVFGTLCYAATYIFRAFRIHRLSKSEQSFFRTLFVCFRHQFYGRIIPFKAGDLSLVYLLGKFCGKSAESAGGTLIAVRFFDGAIMLSAFIICALFSMGGTGLYIILASLLLAVLLGTPFIAKKFICFIGNRFPKNKFIQFINKICTSLSEFSVKDCITAVGSTTALWFFLYLSMHFTALSFGIETTLPQTVTASFLASAAAVLPVNGLGGFGVTESGWTAGFVMIGADRNAALSSGIASNLMSFAVICIFGAISFIPGGKKDV